MKMNKQLLVAGLILAMAAQAQATLLVRYTFDEAISGTTTALNNGGSAGSAANGVFSGNATRTSSTPVGPSTASLNLNPNGGNDDTVGPSGDVNALDALSAMTVSTWINVQGDRSLPFYALASDLHIVPSVAIQGWEFYYTPVGNANVMQLGLQVDATGKDATASVTAPNNSWVFIAAAWDQASGQVKFYSGTPTTPVAQVGTTLTGLTTTMTDNTGLLRVGANETPTGNDRTPNAFMDDFRVYNTALSLGELQGVWFEMVVPEPSTILLLAVGGTLVWRRRRRS
jgi:Concanavalin A-like lectin/glucanases superfamily/PEP-CTERM motif